MARAVSRAIRARVTRDPVPVLRRLALRAGQRLLGRQTLRRLLARRAVESLLDALDAASRAGTDRLGEAPGGGADPALVRARHALELLGVSLPGEAREELRRLLAGLAVVERGLRHGSRRSTGRG